MNLSKTRPWHIELRRDTGYQEILIEDDIHGHEESVVKIALSWQKQYNQAYENFHYLDTGSFHSVLVVTNNWTGECVYQASSKPESK